MVDRPAAPSGRDRAEHHAEHEPGDRHDAEQPQRVRRRRGHDVGHLPTAQVGAEVAMSVRRQAVDERAEARVAGLVVAGVVEAVARLHGGQLRGARDAVAEERQRRVAVELDGERREQVQREHHQEQREHAPAGSGERCSGPSAVLERGRVPARCAYDVADRAGDAGHAVVAHLQQAQLRSRR